jgi:protease II
LQNIDEITGLSNIETIYAPDQNEII